MFAVSAFIVVKLVIGFRKKSSHAVPLLVPLVSVDVPQNSESDQKEKNPERDPLNESLPRLDPSVIEDKYSDEQSCEGPAKVTHESGVVFVLRKVSDVDGEGHVVKGEGDDEDETDDSSQRFEDDFTDFHRAVLLPVQG